LAALILRDSVKTSFKPTSLELIPTTHAGRNADQVAEGSMVFFADVSPTVEDEEQLRKCRCVVILDHHASATAAQRRLESSLPNLKNFSDDSGIECGASIVNRFCSSKLVPEGTLHLFHKMDVFQHNVPDDAMKNFDAFKGFITQKGFGRCTVDLVEEFLAHTEDCLYRGSLIYTKTAASTRALFESRKMVRETETLALWAVEVPGDYSEATDLELYQKLIDQIPKTKAILFATFNRTRLSNGLWSVGLRRGAGDTLDVGKVASKLGTCAHLNFKTGGGHPYAAGAQCGDFEQSTASICDELVQICQGMLPSEAKGTAQEASSRSRSPGR